MDCTNHPGVESTGECWNCYRPFCNQCLGHSLIEKDPFGHEILVCPDCRKIKIIDNLAVMRNRTPGTCVRCGTPVREDVAICHRCAGIAPEFKKAGKGALWSLGLSMASVLSCGLTAFPGFILGIIELKKIKRGEAPTEGKVIAWAGTIIGAFVVFGILLALTALLALGLQ